jgi:ubiquinone/menaquinone biosynthesis C-methylase UbiE
MKKDYYSYIKEGFKRWSNFYDIWTMPILRVRDKVVGFADARSGSIMLDVATGTGGWAIAFARKGYNVIGIDIS